MPCTVSIEGGVERQQPVQPQRNVRAFGTGNTQFTESLIGFFLFPFFGQGPALGYFVYRRLGKDHPQSR